MELASIFKNNIWGVFRLKKKRKPGGRRKKTVSNLLNDSFYKTLQMNDRLREEVAAKHFGHADVLEKLSPVNLLREELMLAALEQAKNIILNNPNLLNHFALKELFSVLGFDPPADLMPEAKKRLTASERNAKDLEGLTQLLEQIKVVREIGGMIGGDSSRGSLSRILTPEVVQTAFSTITALIDARQRANNGQSTGQKVMVKTRDGIVEMSFPEYQQYLAETGLADLVAPEQKLDNDSQALPGTPGNVESNPQSERLAGAGEASTPVSLRVSKWASWVGKDPAEFVRNIVSEAAEGDAEAQAALTFLQHCSLQQVVALLEANKGSSDDPALESAITALLAHQEWLKAAIELVKQQNGAPGEV